MARDDPAEALRRSSERACCRGSYHRPDFIRDAHVSCRRYRAWLDREARLCYDRDSGLKASRPTRQTYKVKIHKVVCLSGGLDFYTGQALRWDLLNHDKPKGSGRRANNRRGRYPSVDHYNGPGIPDFRICSGSVNAAKHSLSHDQFVALCTEVVAHARASGPKRCMR